MKNKLRIANDTEIMYKEKWLGKRRAIELFEDGLLKSFEVGTFAGLTKIHRYLFQDIYDFAGKMRMVNIAKGGFRFAPVLYLSTALDAIDAMSQTSFDEIIEKYIEMNIAHPFREGNGRSTRIWLDAILKYELEVVVDWSLVDKDDYLVAMELSSVRNTEIKVLLDTVLTDRIDDRQIYLGGLDASYRYEGYDTYEVAEID